MATDWEAFYNAAQEKKNPVKSKTTKRSPKTDYKAIFLNHLKFAGLPQPTHGQGCELPEFQFHETRKWRFDFAWPEKMIAVEYQGINWQPKSDNKSGHQSISGLIRDCEKFTEASLAGWTLILITAESVNSGQAVGWIERALKFRTSKTGAEGRGMNDEMATRKI